MSHSRPTSLLFNGHHDSFPTDVKWLQHETDHSPLSSTKVNNACRHTSTPPYTLMTWCLINMIVNIKLSHVLKQHAMKAYEVVSEKIHCFVNFSKCWMSMGNFMPPLYDSWRKICCYQLNRKDGPRPPNIQLVA